MKPLKSIAVGFFATALAISAYSIFRILRTGDPWLGWLYTLILIPPLTFAVYLWHNRARNAPKLTVAEKISRVLFALQGAALACWAYDLATTFYAINVARVAYEINPLGWPLGAAGAMSYYAPTVILSYVLLFKLKAKISVVAAVPITAVALIMGSMNLNAGAGNFLFFILTAEVSSGARTSLLALVAAADLAFAFALAVASRRRVLQTRRFALTKKP